MNIKKRLSLFLFIGLLGLVAILIGFARPFIIPLSQGSFTAPTIVYIHGAFALLWVLLFTTQSLLIQTKKYKFHKKLGILGLLIASGVAITIIPVGLYSCGEGIKTWTWRNSSFRYCWKWHFCPTIYFISLRWPILQK